MPTWHITVGAGRDVARRAAAGLRGHTAGHGVQHQDDGVDEGWVRADQPATQKHIINENVSHFPLTHQPACDVRHKLTTHMSSMLGSVNCTNRSLSWSTPVKIQMYFLEVVVMYFLNMYLHHAEISSGCTIYYSRHVLPKATGSDLSPGVATMI